MNSNEGFESGNANPILPTDASLLRGSSTTPGNLGEEEISKATVLFGVGLGVGLGEVFPEEELDVELEDELVEPEVEEVVLEVDPEVLSGVKILPELLEELVELVVEDVLLMQVVKSEQIFGFDRQQPFTQQFAPHMENEQPPPVDVEELVDEVLEVEPEELEEDEVVDPDEELVEEVDPLLEEVLDVEPEEELDEVEEVVQRLLIEQV